MRWRCSAAKRSRRNGTRLDKATHACLKTTHGCARGGGMTRGRLLIVSVCCSTETCTSTVRATPRRGAEKRYTRVGASAHANTNTKPTAACPPILLTLPAYPSYHHLRSPTHHHPRPSPARPRPTPYSSPQRLPAIASPRRLGRTAAAPARRVEVPRAWPHNDAHAPHSSADAPPLSPASDSFGLHSPPEPPPSSGSPPVSSMHQ